MQKEEIKILIVDDSISWIKSLSILLNMEENMVVIGAAETINKGRELIELNRPDIVLLDLYFTVNSPEGLLFIHEIKDKVKVIITTMSENPDHAKAALMSGAKEFVIKENVSKLPVIIEEVYNRWITAELLADVARNNETLAKEKKKNDLLTEFKLTCKEKEIFYLLEKQLNRAEISKAMYISKDTVKNHITSILEKLSVKNTKQAVKKIETMIKTDRVGGYPLFE